MKLKIFLTICLCYCLFAEEKITSSIRSPYTFISAGVGTSIDTEEEHLPWVALTLGRRSQWESHGFEASLQATSFICWFTQIRLNFLYHYYIKQYLSSQLYFGAGLAPGMVIESPSHWNHKGDRFFSLSPVIDTGYEYHTSSGHIHFISLQISSPLARLNEHECPLFLLLNYGFGF